MLVVLCGVAGAGKTTIGMRLAEALELPFVDADDFHPASNVEKMACGIPLDDADRQPWLETLATELRTCQEQGGAVLACAALRESNRVALESRCAESIRWILLTASEETLAKRLASRKGHFFDRNLLGSQLETLEVPEYAWAVDVERPPQELVNTILERLSGECTAETES